LNNCYNQNYEWELIPKEIASNQLKQKVGNCYMVSALESISHIPYLLTYIFGNEFSAKQQKFKVNFKQSNGKSEIYLVLNNFPVDEKKKLKYMEPLEKEAYAIIFEKVWAVIRKGGYENIREGKTYEVLNRVLGTDATYLYNDNMKVFDLDPNDYIKSMEKVGKKNYKSYDKIVKEKEEVKQSDKNNIKKDRANKIKSKESFKLIREAEKNNGAIITASINMKNGGHAYSVLGTYTTKNPLNGKIQDFVILKNPWRSGKDIKEKINLAAIENQIYGLNEIISINREHYKTGVFYMPREYFEGWFRNICICKPNYKEFFPKVYDALTLYKYISEYYNVDSGKLLFDSTQGNELIKTDIISKKNFKTLQKVIQQINSGNAYVYDKQTLSTIWSDGKNNIESSCHYYFVKEKNSFNVKMKKENEIYENDFKYGEVFSPSISYHNREDHCYRVIRLAKINTFSQIKPQALKKRDFVPLNISTYSEPKFEFFTFEINTNKNEHAFNINEQNNDDENKNNYFKNKLNLNYMEKYDYQIKEQEENKFVYIRSDKTINVKDGWSDISKGVNLVSEIYKNGHYHTHFYGNNYSNLFSLKGKRFKCSCYFLKNGKRIKDCGEYFTFNKTVRFYDCVYSIEEKIKFCIGSNYDEYSLVKGKFYTKIKKSKRFHII